LYVLRDAEDARKSIWKDCRVMISEKNIAGAVSEGLKYSDFSLRNCAWVK
jgi:hypothetical protein